MLNIPKNLIQNFPFLNSVASGNVEGMKIVKKFGFNPLVGATSETVWDFGGLYIYPDTPQTITISSDDAKDTSIGPGVGAISVTVFGVDSNYDEFEITVDLEGLSPVTVSDDILRADRVIVKSAGSTGYNEGTIYVGYGAVALGIPASKLAIITPTFNQSQMAVYTVPAGKVCFLEDYYNNTGAGKDATVQSYARPFGEVFQLKRIVSSFENNFYYPNRMPFFFDEKTDVEIRALSAAAGAPVSAGFDMLIVDKDKIFGR